MQQLNTAIDTVRTFLPEAYNPLYSTLTCTEYPVRDTDYVFRVLNRKQDVERAFKLRYDVFCTELGVITPEQFPNHMECDEYDDNSIHCALFESDEMIAYARLILPCNAFPIESACSLPGSFRRSTTVEISRGLVVQHMRRTDSLWHLIASAYRLCQDNDVDSMLCFTRAVIYNGFRKRGYPLLYVGDPVLFRGHKSYPLIIPIQAGDPASFDRQQRIVQ